MAYVRTIHSNITQLPKFCAFFFSSVDASAAATALDITAFISFLVMVVHSKLCGSCILHLFSLLVRVFNGMPKLLDLLFFPVPSDIFHAVLDDDEQYPLCFFFHVQIAKCSQDSPSPNNNL